MGLIQRRRRKPGLYRPRPSELTAATHPNHVRTFDYKGWFLTQDRIRCDPLSVCDRFSNYIIGCHARFNQQYQCTYLATRKMMGSLKPPLGCSRSSNFELAPSILRSDLA